MPLVSIGIPVYNGEHVIRVAVDSLLAQTFRDFEIIISDNASTDATEIICREYTARDERVKYFRQTSNLGPSLNFEFVLSHAVGKYFMWNAADDRRSRNFLEVNVRALESNPSLSASTSPNCFDGQENELSEYINFDLRGDLAERYVKFLKNAWTSHGVFYSLMRTEILRHYKFPERAYAAFDWSIGLILLGSGEISRERNGLTIFGKNGVSRQGNPWRTFRIKPIEIAIPLYEFTRFALPLTVTLNSLRIEFIIEVMRLNLEAMRSNLLLTIANLLGKK